MVGITTTPGPEPSAGIAARHASELRRPGAQDQGRRVAELQRHVAERRQAAAVAGPDGRAILGLGVSGPQVVEGWYGMPSRKPLARTREYVEILRQAFRREGPLEFRGDHYQLPYTGEGAEGLGKPLKIMTHPLREIPIWIGAEGPKNVTQTCQIADGWIPLYYSCLLYTSPSPRDVEESRMPSSA